MEDPEERRDRQVAGPPVQRLGAAGDRRGIWLPLALLAAVVAGGLLGSWVTAPGRPFAGPALDRSPGAAPASGGAASGDAVPAGSAVHSAEPADPYADLVVTCGYPSGWRAATLQHWLGRRTPIRTWTAEDPVPAEGPADPAIPFAPVATDLVLAIGYCSPVGSEQPPQGIEVEIWAVPEAGPPAGLPLDRLEPPDANALGGLWLPPAGHRVDLDGRTGWAPGRYALRLVARSFDRWLGLEIEDISDLRGPGGPGAPTVPGATPSPSAGSSPGATPGASASAG